MDIFTRGQNIIANSLSRLNLQNIKQTDSCSNEYACAEHFVLDKNFLPPHAHPLSYNTIMKHEQHDVELINMAKSNSVYALQEFPCTDSACKLINMSKEKNSKS